MDQPARAVAYQAAQKQQKQLQQHVARVEKELADVQAATTNVLNKYSNEEVNGVRDPTFFDAMMELFELGAGDLSELVDVAEMVFHKLKLMEANVRNPQYQQNAVGVLEKFAGSLSKLKLPTDEDTGAEISSPLLDATKNYATKTGKKLQSYIDTINASTKLMNKKGDVSGVSNRSMDIKQEPTPEAMALGPRVPQPASARRQQPPLTHTGHVSSPGQAQSRPNTSRGAAPSQAQQQPRPNTSRGIAPSQAQQQPRPNAGQVTTQTRAQQQPHPNPSRVTTQAQAQQQTQQSAGRVNPQGQARPANLDVSRESQQAQSQQAQSRRANHNASRPSQQGQNAPNARVSNFVSSPPTSQSQGPRVARTGNTNARPAPSQNTPNSRAQTMGNASNAASGTKDFLSDDDEPLASGVPRNKHMQQTTNAQNSGSSSKGTGGTNMVNRPPHTAASASTPGNASSQVSNRPGTAGAPRPTVKRRIVESGPSQDPLSKRFKKSPQ